MIEVIVALAVLAIALGAVIEGITAHVGNAGYLRDRTLAHWVAMNKAAEIHLAEGWPAVGSNSGTMLLADYDWHWTVTVMNTLDEDVRRADIEVSAEDGSASLAKVIAYVGQPL